jgi:hypothetical protein
LNPLSQVRCILKLSASAVVNELNDRFPADNLVRAAGILYPQFYRNGSVALNFKSNLEMLIQTYGLVRADAAGQVVGPLVDSDKLREQAKAFKSFAAGSAKQIVYNDVSKVTQMWRLMSALPLFQLHCSEWSVLAEVVLVMVGVSVEDERVFSAMNFIKNALRNRLGTHLERCVRMKGQNEFKVATFPYDEVHASWVGADSKDHAISHSFACL